MAVSSSFCLGLDCISFVFCVALREINSKICLILTLDCEESFLYWYCILGRFFGDCALLLTAPDFPDCFVFVIAVAFLFEWNPVRW
jgi:hypothetical protein